VTKRRPKLVRSSRNAVILSTRICQGPFRSFLRRQGSTPCGRKLARRVSPTFGVPHRDAGDSGAAQRTSGRFCGTREQEIMRSSLLREGGPYKVRRTGTDQFEMKIPLPADAEGRVARECPSRTCSPGYFKVKPGTGIVAHHTEAFCPYCRFSAKPSEFTTKRQRQYAKDVMLREAHSGIQDMAREAFGIGPTGKRSLGGGLLKLEISLKQTSPPSVSRPLEAALQRAVICPHCGLDHAVFGLAVWCADCGADIFVTHVQAELDVIERMLGDVQRRRDEFGARIAAKDVENCLEDLVSIYEAVLRTMLVRSLRQRQLAEVQIEHARKQIRNGLQNVARSAQIIAQFLGCELLGPLSTAEIEALRRTFEKRHPITHNLGVVDRKYLEGVQTADREGREILVKPAEVSRAIAFVGRIVNELHRRLFGSRAIGRTMPPESSQ
jgi:hypothetical protein